LLPVRTDVEVCSSVGILFLRERSRCKRVRERSRALLDLTRAVESAHTRALLKTPPLSASDHAGRRNARQPFATTSRTPVISDVIRILTTHETCCCCWANNVTRSRSISRQTGPKTDRPSRFVRSDTVIGHLSLRRPVSDFTNE